VLKWSSCSASLILCLQAPCYHSWLVLSLNINLFVEWMKCGNCPSFNHNLVAFCTFFSSCSFGTSMTFIFCTLVYGK
jgi:hypothetical protein